MNLSEEVRCISHGLCKGKPCIYPKCMTEELLRVEEVNAMIKKKSEELYPYEDNFLGQPIRRSKYKDSVDNERKQWQAGVLFVLSDPELLSKAGYVKKEEDNILFECSIALHSAWRQLIKIENRTISQNTSLSLINKVLDKLSLYSPPQNK